MSKQDDVSALVALVKTSIMGGSYGNEKQHRIPIKLWIKRVAIISLSIISMGQPFKAVTDEYIESSLCGWGGLNADPCKDVKTIKIYTAMPGAGEENIESMKKLSLMLSKWIERNKSTFGKKNIEIELLNMWGNHYYPNPIDETQISVAVFIYLSETTKNIAFSSASKKSTQILNYSCNSEPDEICKLNLIDMGMQYLLKDLQHSK